MRRITSLAMLAAATLLIGAGCKSSTTITPTPTKDSATAPNNPAVTPDRVYPGMAPYKPPTTPPPSTNHNDGPQ